MPQVADAKVRDPEAIEIMAKLIESMTVGFGELEFKDQYAEGHERSRMAEALRNLLNDKAQGRETVKPAPKVEQPTPDIIRRMTRGMSVLKASIEQAKKGTVKAAAPPSKNGGNAKLKKVA